MDFGSSPIKFVWCSTNPIYWDSLISYEEPLVYTCRPIYWIETLVWHNSEQGIWSAMQSSTSSIIMENKQRHGIWSLLKALFSLCYYLCSSSNEVLWGCMKWFSLKLMVAYLHSKLLALFFFILHEVAILLNGQYLDYSGLYFQIVGCLLMNIAYWQMIPSLFSEWGVNPFISTN